MLIAEGLTQRDGDDVVADDVSFRVDAGTVAAVVGDASSCKTTILEVLAGVTSPSAGRVTVGGLSPHEARRLGRLAVVAVSDADPGRTASQYLERAAEATGVGIHRIAHLLELAGLLHAAHRPIASYTQAMRCRLAVARALLTDPDVLVVDDAARGLDAPAAMWLNSLIRDLARAGRTVVIGAEDIADVSAVADQLLCIRGARLVDDDEPAQESPSDGWRPPSASAPAAAAIAVVGAHRNSRHDLALKLAQTLGRTVGDRVLFAAFAADDGELALTAPEETRSELHLGDLIDDVRGFDSTCEIAPYVSPAAPGLDLLAGPPSERSLAKVSPALAVATLAFARRFYEMIVIYIGAVGSATARSLLRRAEVIVTLDDELPATARGSPGQQQAVLEVTEAVLDAAATPGDPAPELELFAQAVYDATREPRSRPPAGSHGET